MIETIQNESNVDQSALEFYNALSPDYDVMTGFDKRFIHERPFFHMIVERFGIKSAIDAGCGSGFHSLLLAQLGVDVTAVDISRSMLMILEGHAAVLNKTIDVVESPFQTLDSAVSRKVDALFCLGNSLVHLLTEEDTRTSLRSFRAVTNPGGILFLQLVNYDRILASGERILSIKKIGEVLFIRFYDFLGKMLRFNILKLEKLNGTFQHTLRSAMIKPIRSSELLLLLREAGFGKVSSYGSVALEEFVSGTSKDLVVIAERP